MASSHNVELEAAKFLHKLIQDSKDEPAKLKIRTIGSGKLKPYLTVVKKGGEFHHVILTVHTNKSDSSWGVVGRGVHLDVDKDVLEDLEL